MVKINKSVKKINCFKFSKYSLSIDGKLADILFSCKIEAGENIDSVLVGCENILSQIRDKNKRGFVPLNVLENLNGLDIIKEL